MTIKNRIKIGVPVFLTLILIASAGWAGVKNPDTFVEATRNSIESLDPHFMLSTATTCIAFNVFDSLLLSNPGSESLSPGLSTTVPSMKNGLVRVDSSGKTDITFPIRKGVKFHDGSLLQPEDVKYTLTRAIIAGSKYNLCQPLTGEGSFKKLSGRLGLEKAYEVIDKAITIDKDSVTFHLPKPFSPFLYILGDNGTAYGIMSKKWCAAQGAWPGTPETLKAFVSLTADKNALTDKMMGTGPFKLESWQKGDRLILTRFDSYWRGKAKLKRVVRKVMTDNAVSVQYLKTGDADFFVMSLADLPQLEGYKGVRVVKDIPSAQLIKMNFNFDIHRDKYIGSGRLGTDGAPRDLFNDIDMRKGFCFAFDYKTFINDVVLGAGKKPYGPVLIGFPTANPDNPQYTFDLEKAKVHLKKAQGGKVWEKGFKLTIPYNAGSVHRQRALELLKYNLNRINPKFQLEITSLPWAAYLGAINDKSIPMSIFGILPKYRHPYAALSYHMGSTDFYADVKGYTDLARQKYDPLIQELSSTYDLARVKRLSHKLQRYSHEDALAIFHYQVIGQVAMREWVKGYEPQMFPFLVDYYRISKE